MQYLNLGCGSTFIENWTNVDFVSNSRFVIAHNLLQGIPFNNNKFDVVYHSHVLEHFPREYAPIFLSECFRVLKPGGILRVVIPDLEQISLNYLKYLNEALNGDPKADKKYEWTVIEMYDQVVRKKSGGSMIEFLKDATKNIDEYILERNGKELDPIIKKIRSQEAQLFKQPSKFKQTLSSFYHFDIGEFLTKVLLRKNYKIYKEGLFRSQGEIHQWMYDRYSLKMILSDSGFKNIVQKTAFTSYVENWADFKLDGEHGVIRKPDSLFMEAQKLK